MVLAWDGVQIVGSLQYGWTEDNTAVVAKAVNAGSPKWKCGRWVSLWSGTMVGGGCGCGGLTRQLNQLFFALALVLVTQNWLGRGEAGLLCSTHAILPTK